MKGLSEEIELAIVDSLKGMVLDVDILELGDDKLSSLVKSRIDSFSAIKELLVTSYEYWQNN
jgi:hypothetical protein